MQERDYERIALRSTLSRAEVDEWALVLTAEGLSPRIDRSGGAFVISVAVADCARAITVLSEYELEHLPDPTPPGIADQPGSTWSLTAALGINAGLLCFFVVTGPRSGGTRWFVEGSSDAALVMAGELWRCVTALTLHADMPHVVGNALFGALFMSAVFRVLGPGLGGTMVLASGLLGNLATALLYSSAHSSVGASSAIFGAVGLLGGLGVMRRRSRGSRGIRAWAPVGAGLALLAMIGTGPRTDLAAHLLGLAAGWLLGAITAHFLTTRPPLAGQWVLGGIGLALLAGSWQIALG
jgi:membrane associated rhomboid family serine protease